MRLMDKPFTKEEKHDALRMLNGLYCENLRER